MGDDIPNNIEVTVETLKLLLDYSSDEIFILNGNKQVIYVNSACEKHYGLKKLDVLGKYSNDLFERGYWSPSIFPEVYKNKKPISIIQTTNIGAELLTSAIPILNDKNEIILILTTARELQSYKMLQFKEYNQVQSTKQQNQTEVNMITHSNKLKNILTFSQKIAITNSTILIQGESGTGKGVLAHYIHQISKRKKEPFLTINCAAIPEELLESELFGYTKGAFTGANPSGKVGLLETANNGTVFLDEIGDISLTLQAKLLQVIQDKEFIPVGGHTKKKVNIRVITATNRNLAKMIENRQFREDLFYRLNVIDIKMPPLRERQEDIIPLIYNFLYEFNREHETNKPISQKCLEILKNYSWPGNIRQLKNLIEKLVIISDSVIDFHDLPEVIHQNELENNQQSAPLTLNEAIAKVKKDMVRKSFQKYRSSRKVAKDLGISQTTATRLIREYCDDLQDRTN